MELGPSSSSIGKRFKREEITHPNLRRNEFHQTRYHGNLPIFLSRIISFFFFFL